MSEVDKDDKNKPDSLEYIYKEYVRLSDQCDAYTRSSFEDFKLLGAIGALMAWPPIAGLDWVNPGLSGHVLFTGFVGIFAVVAILATRDLLKGSLIGFYMKELATYEEELRVGLGDADMATFRVARHWPEWRIKKHFPVNVRFRLLFFLFLFCYPVAILAAQWLYWYAAIYGGIALVTLGIYVSAARVLERE